MAVVAIFIQGLTRSAASIYGLLAPENFPQNEDADNESDAAEDIHTSSSDDEQTNLIHRKGIFRDIEEGGSSSSGQSKSADKFELESMLYSFYFVMTTCGLIGSLYSFGCGMVFYFTCTEARTFPGLFISMGVWGTVIQLYILSKLLRKGFGGLKLKVYIEAVLLIFFIFLLLQWTIAVLTIYVIGTKHEPFSRYCRPETYSYTVIANLIPILAFIVRRLMNCCRRKKE